MIRTLALKRESLTELTTDELTHVVGADGTHITCYTGLTYCPCTGLINDPEIPSIDSPCGTR
jgi:hypothetical protein